MADQQSTSGDRSRLEACSVEPIRTPGSIQPHGAFVAVDRESRVIVAVSENSLEFLGAPPDEVVGHTIREFVGEAVVPAMRAAAAGANPTDAEANGRRYDAILHRSGPLTFVEFEPRIEFDDRESASAAYAAALRLSALRTRAELLDTVAQEFSSLTGFDRVMVYHFHPDGHGEVVSEVAAPGMEPYLGLHFPASDIPAQARDLYLTKLSRAIVSTTRPNVGLVGHPDFAAQQLDLSVAELRAVSPFHLQFMRNMGQASTVSFSLIHGGELIGMITCAHREEKRLPFLIRRGLEVLANQVAIQLGAIAEVAALKQESRSQDLRAHLLGKMVASDDIAGALLTGTFTFLDVIEADAAALRLDGVLSRTPDAPLPEELDRLLAAIDLAEGALSSSSLSSELPTVAAIIPRFAGLLVAAVGNEGDYIAFFRREVIQSIDWLGDLTEQNRAEVLSPRLSFSAWRQSVTGKSLPWDGLPREALALARDIEGARLRRRESRLATLAMHDSLTGLSNRRALMEELDRVAELGIDLSLLFIDLDNFKSVNDSHGHEAGDSVIIETGRRLVEQTRNGDRVARLGGDEFVVMCERTSRDDAEAMARRIADALREPIAEEEHVVTASIGIVTFGPGSSPGEMLEQADAAMYRAKQSGRDGISF